MTVARILDEKGRDVFTTQPHRTLKEVIGLLAEKGVGAVVVSDASLSVLGILSERDVVRAIAEHGAAGVNLKVSQLISVQKLVSCASTDSLEHVRHLMNVHHIRHLPVIDDFALAGVISMRDVSTAFDEAAGGTPRAA